jgi:hypothetical protein
VEWYTLTGQLLFGSDIKTESELRCHIRDRPKALGLLDYAHGWAGLYLLRRGLFLPYELKGVMSPDLAREGMRRLQPLRRLAANPVAGSALAKSPKPSTDTTTASSNGEAWNADDKCARWCSIWCVVPRKPSLGNASLSSSGICRHWRRFLRRLTTRRISGGWAATEAVDRVLCLSR